MAWEEGAHQGLGPGLPSAVTTGLVLSPAGHIPTGCDRGTCCSENLNLNRRKSRAFMQPAQLHLGNGRREKQDATCLFFFLIKKIGGGEFFLRCC